MIMTQCQARGTGEKARFCYYGEWMKKKEEYRLAERKSQKTLSELSGVSVSTISHFEQGSAENITLKSFMALLRAMGGEV